MCESEPTSRVTIRPLREFQIRSGNYEAHSREGDPLYRGVPWNLKVEMDPESEQARVIFWVDDADFQLDDSDEAVFDRSFNIGNVEPRSLKLFTWPNGSLLQLVLVPRTISEGLSPIPMTTGNTGLLRFCLKHTKVLMDDTFVLGSISGFGEKITLDVPDRALIRMALEPRADRRPIGRYEDGVISIPLEDGHELSLSGVRIGPMGNDLAGPYIVYGTIRQSTTSLADMREVVESRLHKQHSGQRLDALLRAFRANPFGALGRVTVGSDHELSEHLERWAGAFGEKLAACSVSG
ncbi:MAG: hypothetical protein U5L08_01445 [Xanthomonadales bacterium]|nr:hypothetical protein [Xanthomonadales bacterium]